MAGKAVTAVLVPCPDGEEAPVCTQEEGALVIAWKGKQWRVEREAEAVVVEGRRFGV